MNVRRTVSRFGAGLAVTGAVLGYFAHSLFLPPLDCVQGAYSLSCASVAERILFALGNFGSVLAAFVLAIPGLVIYFVAAPKDDAE